MEVEYSEEIEHLDADLESFGEAAYVADMNFGLGWEGWLIKLDSVWDHRDLYACVTAPCGYLHCTA